MTDSDDPTDVLLGVMSTCRAMRRLTPDPVSDADVRRLVEAANCAPSGRNLQRARWIVVRDAEQRRAVADLNRRACVEHATAERDAARELPHHDRERRRKMWDAVPFQRASLGVKCWPMSPSPIAPRMASVRA